MLTDSPRLRLVRTGSAAHAQGFQALLRIPQGVAIFSYMAWDARGGYHFSCSAHNCSRRTVICKGWPDFCEAGLANMLATPVQG